MTPTPLHEAERKATAVGTTPGWGWKPPGAGGASPRPVHGRRCQRPFSKLVLVFVRGLLPLLGVGGGVLALRLGSAPFLLAWPPGRCCCVFCFHTRVELPVRLLCQGRCGTQGWPRGKKFENSEASARLQRTRFLCGGRPLALGCGRCWINGPQRPTTPGPSHWKGRFPPSPPASAACECLGLEMGLSRAFSGSAVVERRWHLAV